MNEVTDEFRRGFAQYRKLAEDALAQVDDDGFFASPGPETNSLAIIVKHIAGNLRSRWTDFLTTDGEKADRARDGEFIITEADTRAALMERWKAGWALVDEQLGPLTDADLGRTVTIRWAPLTVLAALQRQLTHAAYHVGQITMLARHYASDWTSLSIPVGQSDAYNAGMREKAEAKGP